MLKDGIFLILRRTEKTLYKICTSGKRRCNVFVAASDYVKALPDSISNGFPEYCILLVLMDSAEVKEEKN
jgi:hypothetical protein